MQLPHRPYMLLIFDGWGYSEETDGNAIAQAQTPNWDKLWNNCPHTLISGSGHDVGLPDGQMGNSEVGHLNLGAGRVVPTDFVRINGEISDGSFEENEVLADAVDAAVETNHAVHILGLLSPGGVHSHEQHIMAMVKLAARRGAKKIYVHAFLDGRDTPPKSALASIEVLEAEFKALGVGEIASVCGRYYAMDRDQRWERVQTAYDVLTQGKAEFHAATAAEAVNAAYARGETDEFVQATVVLGGGDTAHTIQDGDSVVFMNFRADRARQITRALTDKTFSGFERAFVPQLASFVCLTQYAEDIEADVAYEPMALHNVFAEYIANLGLKQLHIAETEKYAHVTFFFNGGREQEFPDEERILIPSPKVATYDLQPEMSANELTEALEKAIAEEKFDVIICNFANPDMVGHTGKMDAAIKAVETVDGCLGRIVIALKNVGGELLVTADHGNVERMSNHETGQAHTAHTSNLVPLVYVGRDAVFEDKHGALTDVIPTLLTVMGLPQPKEMTGESLISMQEK